MSELPDEYRDFIQRAEEGIREARARGIPEDEIARAEQIIQRIRNEWDSIVKSLSPSPEELELRAFAKRLAARQGTVMPDFDALYKKKVDLDRHFDQTHDPRS